MLLSAEVFRDDTKYIDVSIITIGFQSKTPKNFHSITDLLEVDHFIVGIFGNFDHPTIDDLS